MVRCRQEGAGNRRQWLYRLAAWRDDAVCAAACDELALLNDSGDTFLNEKDIRKREEREERVSLDEMLRLMRGNEVWRRSFCESNGLSEAELDGLLVLFARKLGNSGVVEKEVSDAYCHFGHWYNRQALQQMRQETERLARASELSAQRDEQLRQEELERARREEESRQAWLRVKAEMQQQAAAKIDRKIKMYADCPIHFEGDDHLLRYIEEKAKDRAFTIDFGTGAYGYKLGTFRPQISANFTFRASKTRFGRWRDLARMLVRHRGAW